MAYEDIKPVGDRYASSEEVPVEEKKDGYDLEVSAAPELLDDDVADDVLQITKDDAEAIHESVRTMTSTRCRAIIKDLYLIHEPDPNFPTLLLRAMETYLSEDYNQLPVEEREKIEHEMKVEAVLATENSPYPEVRAVVDTDPAYDQASLTLRVWIIGSVYVAAGAFINQLFSIRQPAIAVGPNVAQLLAYPAGKALEAVLPDKGFMFRGERWSLNPGKFSRKEHMLITIMANVGFTTPYTANIILTQFLPQYFNQKYAQGFAYQILIGLGTNFVGYGMAGITRRFLVYPASCVWPTSLVTIALNKSFHTDKNTPVPGPFGRIYNWSRMKLFLVAFCAMFAYYWLPGFLFPALSTFNWISWIAPTATALNNIVGSNNGLGINPWPTFDWNIISYLYDPLVLPFYSYINSVLGLAFSVFFVVAFYWTNAYNTAYLPINSNHVYDNMGQLYNVSQVTDSRGIFDEAGYKAYSPAFMAAGNLVVYFFFFATYAATVSYAFLFHRHEISSGVRQAWKSFRAKKTASPDQEEDLAMDVHQRIQAEFPEVSEWYYLATLLVAAGIGMAGIGAFKTYTNPGVVLFGILLCLLFVIPIGLIYAITGIQVTLNVLAEFIGGAWVKGNALSMNYFKAFGYITCAQAVSFASDLKLAHYAHIPPWHTFSVQMVGTLISTFVCTGVFNYQLHIENVCTSAAKFRFSCPGINTFFTAAVFWGTLGPERIFGPHGEYKLILLGFPFGFFLPIIYFFARKRFPNVGWLRQVHPVVFVAGALNGAPYNLSYFWPAFPFSYACWRWLRIKHLAFWSKYNYVLAAALPAGIAISSIIIFFALQYNNSVTFEWWGTDVPYLGCEGEACTRLTIDPDVGYFGPAPGSW